MSELRHLVDMNGKRIDIGDRFFIHLYERGWLAHGSTVWQLGTYPDGTLAVYEDNDLSKNMLLPPEIEEKFKNLDVIPLEYVQKDKLLEKIEKVTKINKE